MFPYCLKPLNYQEVSISGKICRKKKIRNTFIVSKYIFKGAANQDILYGRKINCLKTPKITSVVYLHVIKFCLECIKEVLYYR